jgi:transposase
MVLPADIQAEILALHFGQHKTTREIAKILGVNRKTVMAVIRRRRVRLEKDPCPRPSILDPHKEFILELVKKDPLIPATVVLQRLRERGFLGGRYTVQEWMRVLRTAPQRPREAFLSLDFAAGETAQVDWGEFGDVFGNGVKIHCFVMVLCYSRLLYIEFTRSEKFEEFIRCHENAFRYFGGVPLECWYDNLTSAVTDRVGALVRFNARFMAYMGHHAIRPHACNPARGNEKGRVEDGVRLLRTSFWPGRSFKDFDDLCQQATTWRDQIANRREHRSIRKVPALFFEAEEKQALRAMNPHPYDTQEVFSRVVPPQFHIVYDTNRYSVAWTLVGMTVTLRVSDTEIRVFYGERLIAMHERSYLKHQTFTKPEHSRGLLERKPGASREGWQLAAVKSIGPAMKEYLELLRAGNRSLKREMSRILALVTIYGEQEVHDCVNDMLQSGIVGVENLEMLLKSRLGSGRDSLGPEPLNFQNTKLNRVVPTVDLRRYDALLFGSSRAEDHSSTSGGHTRASNETGVESHDDNNESGSGTTDAELTGDDEF